MPLRAGPLWLQGHSLLHVLKQVIERIRDGLSSIGP